MKLTCFFVFRFLFFGSFFVKVAEAEMGPLKALLDFMEVSVI